MILLVKHILRFCIVFLDYFIPRVEHSECLGVGELNIILLLFLGDICNLFQFLVYKNFFMDFTIMVSLKFMLHHHCHVVGWESATPKLNPQFIFLNKFWKSI